MYNSCCSMLSIMLPNVVHNALRSASPDVAFTQVWVLALTATVIYRQLSLKLWFTLSFLPTRCSCGCSCRLSMFWRGWGHPKSMRQAPGPSRIRSGSPAPLLLYACHFPNHLHVCWLGSGIPVTVRCLSAFVENNVSKRTRHAWLQMKAEHSSERDAFRKNLLGGRRA